MQSDGGQKLTRTVGTSSLLACAATYLLAAAAGAQPVDDATRSQAIRIADLNLMATQGRLILDRRLKRAVDDVWASSGALSLYEEATRPRCVRDAMEAVLPRVRQAHYDATS